MNGEAQETGPGGEVAVYESGDGEVRVDVHFDRETVWLTQRQMAEELFDTTPENVLMHLRNVFASGELEADGTTKEFLAVRTEGRRRVRRRLTHYNLDAIISVGYRVNSRRGVRFRQWATRTLREHLAYGYTVNERRLAERGLREARETNDLLVAPPGRIGGFAGGPFAIRLQSTIPGGRCWRSSRDMPTRGACFWSTTRTGCQRGPGPARQSAYWITGAPPVQSRNSSAS